MSKKSIAHSHVLVQLEKSTTVLVNQSPLTDSQERQLGQLARLAPDLYTEVIDVMARFPGVDHGRRIAGAMQYLFSRLTTTPRTTAAYDLVIASKKYGFGSTSHAHAPIKWWKFAGQDKETPDLALTDPVVQEMLEDYELVDTEPRPSLIVRRYRRKDRRQ